MKSAPLQPTAEATHSICVSANGVVYDENLFLGSYEDCKEYIRESYEDTHPEVVAFLSKSNLDIKCESTGRLVSYIIN